MEIIDLKPGVGWAALGGVRLVVCVGWCPLGGVRWVLGVACCPLGPGVCPGPLGGVCWVAVGRIGCGLGFVL